MSSNSGPKSRVRQYAKEHQISYQQAQLALGFTGACDEDYALTIGMSVTTETTKPRPTEYTLHDQETVWRPFSTRTGPCVLIDSGASFMTSALAYQTVSHPTDPVTDILMVTTTPDPENDIYLHWMTTDPAINFANFAISNEDIGYAAASPAAAALRTFHPRGVGLVVLQLEDPYDQVTPQTNAEDFENYRGTEWEELFRPQELTDGPYWSENIGFAESITHVLSDDDQRNYDDLLTEVSGLLDRAVRDRIIVLLSGTDLVRTLTRFPVQRFGTRLSGALHLEYRQHPRLNTTYKGQAPLHEMFPSYEQTLTADNLRENPFAQMPGKVPFWYGMNPKNGRVVLARLNDRQTSEWLLLTDPPDVPDYWSPLYSAFQDRYLR